jgi:hypothetical protein
MSETANTTDTTIEIEIKAKEHKEKEPKAKDENYDPYCCTPPGGDTGADTKP